MTDAELLALREALRPWVDVNRRPEGPNPDEFSDAQTIYYSTAEAAEQAKAQIEAPWREALAGVLKHDANKPVCFCAAHEDARALLDEAGR